jgi:hypothetical protein
LSPAPINRSIFDVSACPFLLQLASYDLTGRQLCPADLVVLLPMFNILVVKCVAAPTDDVTGEYILITISLQEFLAKLIANYFGAAGFQAGDTLTMMFKKVSLITRIFENLTNGWIEHFPLLSRLFLDQLLNLAYIGQNLGVQNSLLGNDAPRGISASVPFEGVLEFSTFFDPKNCARRILPSTMHVKTNGLYDLYSSAFSGAARFDTFNPYNVNAAAGGAILDIEYIYCWVGKEMASFNSELGVFSNSAGGLITHAALENPVFPLKEWTFAKSKQFGFCTAKLYEMLSNFVTCQAPQDGANDSKELVELFLTNFAARKPVLVGGQTRPHAVPLHVLHEYLRHTSVVAPHGVLRVVDVERNTRFIVGAANRMLMTSPVEVRINVLDESIDFYGIALDFSTIARSVVCGVRLHNLEVPPGPLAGAIAIGCRIIATKQFLLSQYDAAGAGQLTHVRTTEKFDTKTSDSDFVKHTATARKMLQMDSWQQLLGSVPSIMAMIVMRKASSHVRVPLDQFLDLTLERTVFKRPGFGLQELLDAVVCFDLGFEKSTTTRMVSLAGITPPIACHNLPDDFSPGYVDGRMPSPAVHVSQMHYCVFADANGLDRFSNLKAAFCFDSLYDELVREEQSDGFLDDKVFSLHVFDIRSAHERIGVIYDGIKIKVSKTVREWRTCLEMVQEHLRLCKQATLDDISDLTFASLRVLAMANGGNATKGRKRKVDEKADLPKRSRSDLTKSQIILNSMFFFLQSAHIKSKVLKNAKHTYALSFPSVQRMAPLMCYGFLALTTDAHTYAKLAQTNAVDQAAATLDFAKLSLTSYLPTVFAARKDTLSIITPPGSQNEAFACLQVTIQKEYKPFIDMKGDEEWFVGPLKENGSQQMLFSYAMLDSVNKRGFFMVSFVSFEVSLNGFAIVSGFCQQKDGRLVVPQSWQQAAGDDCSRLLGYRSLLIFKYLPEHERILFNAPHDQNDMRASDLTIVEPIVNMAPEVLLEMFHAQIVHASGKHAQPAACYIGDVRHLGFSCAEIGSVNVRTDHLRKQKKVFEDGVTRLILSNPILHNVAAQLMDVIDFLGEVLCRVIMPLVCADPSSISKSAPGVSTSTAFLLFSIFDDVCAPSFETKRLHNGCTGELTIFALTKGQKLTSEIYAAVGAEQVTAQDYLANVFRVGAWPSMTESLTVHVRPSGKTVKFINSASVTMVENTPTSLVRLMSEQTEKACSVGTDNNVTRIDGKTFINQVFCMKTKKGDDLNTSKIGLFAFHAATLEVLSKLKLITSDLLQTKLMEVRKDADLAEFRKEMARLKGQNILLRAMQRNVAQSPVPVIPVVGTPDRTLSSQRSAPSSAGSELFSPGNLQNLEMLF